MAEAAISSVGHIALVTRDFGRLAAFYREVFDAHDPYGRSAGDDARGLGFIAIGDAAVLHVFEQPTGPLGGVTDGDDAPFARGRIDHFSLEAADLDAFSTLRERLIDRGASDGSVTDFGPLVSVFYADPDGFQCELSLTKPERWDPPFETQEPARPAARG